MWHLFWRQMANIQIPRNTYFKIQNWKWWRAHFSSRLMSSFWSSHSRNATKNLYHIDVSHYKILAMWSINLYENCNIYFASIWQAGHKVRILWPAETYLIQSCLPQHYQHLQLPYFDGRYWSNNSSSAAVLWWMSWSEWGWAGQQSSMGSHLNIKLYPPVQWTFFHFNLFGMAALNSWAKYKGMNGLDPVILRYHTENVSSMPS